MFTRGSKSPIGVLNRLLAVALVMLWSLAPVVCASADEIEPGDAGVGLHHSHHGEHSRDLDDHCCRSLASAKVLLAEPLALPSVKIVSSKVVEAFVATDNTFAVVEFGPLRASTGPPRIFSEPARYYTYNALAPPAPAA